MMPLQIWPSLLAADFGRLAEELRRVEASGADGLHLDIMDGHFVPNISFGPAVVQMARRHTALPFSVHLMLSRPDHYVQAFAAAGATVLLIHIEAPCDVPATLRAIRAAGVRPGLTLNPETPVELLRPALEAGLVEEVLCMSVHPGFGGQTFMDCVLPKVQALRRDRPAMAISIDGGVDLDTAPRAAAAGANVLIAGTSLFQSADMAGAVRRMRAVAEQARAAEPSPL